MTRDERELELRMLMYGRYFELAEQYLRAAGLPPGTTLPMGLRVTQMIQFILDTEFSGSHALACDCQPAV